MSTCAPDRAARSSTAIEPVSSDRRHDGCLRAIRSRSRRTRARRVSGDARSAPDELDWPPVDDPSFSDARRAVLGVGCRALRTGRNGNHDLALVIPLGEMPESLARVVEFVRAVDHRHQCAPVLSSGEDRWDHDESVPGFRVARSFAPPITANRRTTGTRTRSRRTGVPSEGDE